MTITRFSFPTTIHFGPGARKLVADHLKAEGVARPLIVTDRGIAPLPLLAELAAGDQRVFASMILNVVVPIGIALLRLNFVSLALSMFTPVTS